MLPNFKTDYNATVNKTVDIGIKTDIETGGIE